MTEKFDPNQIDLSSWGKKAEGSKKTAKKTQGSKKEKPDTNSDEELTDKSSRNAKKNANTEFEEKFKQLTDQITQLKQELTDSKTTPKKLVEKAELEAFIQKDGTESLKHWLFDNKTVKNPKGGPRKNDIQFLLNMINHFLFK